MVQIEYAWRELLRKLEGGGPWRSVFVIGSTGSGKTTFCRFLGEWLSRRWRTAAVDCDPGQSALGLPTSLALAWEPWDGGRPLALRFVGSTSPAGHFLAMLSGVKRLADLAVAEGAQKLVFDSSGYMDFEAGREFHFHLVDMLGPDHLVAIQQGAELEPLLGWFARGLRPRVHRLPVSSAVRVRSREERRAYREGKFAAYFAGATLQALPLDGIGLVGVDSARGREGEWRQRLVALCDRRGFVVALGIGEALDLERGVLWLRAPAFEPGQVALIMPGSLRLDSSGREIWPSLAGDIDKRT